MVWGPQAPKNNFYGGPSGHLAYRPVDHRARTAEYVRIGAPLLTLTGPGGVGKTRLALQAAGELLDAFPDGVWFVELAPISDPALVAGAIAVALGVRESGQRPVLDLLTRHLLNQDLLLILDNFEQVLAAAPRLRVLTTSRTASRLSGEQEYAVPTLEVPQRAPPPALERITQYEAVRLFIARATAVRADSSVSAANAPVIAEICHDCRLCDRGIYAVIALSNHL